MNQYLFAVYLDELNPAGIRQGWMHCGKYGC